MYRAYGLLLPTSDYTSEEAHRRFTARFPQYAVLLGGDGQITVESAVWEIEARLNTGPEVQTESVGLAEKLVGLGDGLDLALCARRVEVWSDTPDPEMEHFADFQTVIEVLKSFGGVVVVDPKEPALM